jgi:hypothetical protein
VSKKKSKDSKRRLEKQARNRAKRKAVAKALRVPKGSKAKAEIKTFALTEHPWWVAHILNYLASDYDEGKWTPLFEAIYDGHKRAPNQEQILAKIAANYQQDEENLTDLGVLLMGFTLMPPATIYTYRLGLIAHFKEKKLPEVDTKKPHHPEVWEYMKAVADEIRARTA